MQPAIRVENLGKRYRIAHTRTRGYRTLRESLVSAAGAPLRRLRYGSDRSATEDFWALNDVSFDVQPGEVVGIIGRNGAGKSTLLKILSRITKPTTGRVRLRGRVGSLLEVGTGFHPELTGRENIFLNGSILGMSRREIARQFDEIVDFAGIEKFLDTPVKRYSSGMYVRLAFAVAAHLEPEILIIDEVLAVGDAEFQKKCLNKIDQIAHGGRTVFLVSHQMPSIVKLSTVVCHLEKGRIAGYGDPATVVERYLGMRADGVTESAGVWFSPDGSRSILKRFEVVDEDGRCRDQIRLWDGVYLQSTIDLKGREGANHNLMITFRDVNGVAVAQIDSLVQSGLSIPGGSAHTVSCQIEKLEIMPGTYEIDVAVGDLSEIIERISAAISLTIQPWDVYGTGLIPNAKQGFIAMDAKWRQASNEIMRG